MRARRPNLIRSIVIWWAAIRRGWPKLAAVTAIGAGAGLAVCALIPPQWEATATLLIPEAQPPGLGASPWSQSRSASFTATVQAVLNSEAMLAEIRKAVPIPYPVLQRSFRIVGTASTRQIRVSAVLPDRRQALRVVEIAVHRAQHIPRELSARAMTGQAVEFRRQATQLNERLAEVDRRLVRYQMNMTSPPVDQIEIPSQYSPMTRLSAISAAALPPSALPAMLAGQSLQEVAAALGGGNPGSMTVAAGLAAPLGQQPGGIENALAAAQAVGIAPTELPTVPRSIHARRLRRLQQELGALLRQRDSAIEAARAQVSLADILPGQAAVVGAGVTLSTLQYVLRTTQITAGPAAPSLHQQRSVFDIARRQVLAEAQRNALSVAAGTDQESATLSARIAVLRWRIEKERALAKAEAEEADGFRRIREEQKSLTEMLVVSRAAGVSAEVQAEVGKMRFEVLDRPYIANHGDPVNNDPTRGAVAGALAFLSIGMVVVCSGAGARHRLSG